MGRAKRPANAKSPNVWFNIWIVLCVIVQSVHPQQLTSCELESMLRDITQPDNINELHATSLRNQLRNLLENTNYDLTSLYEAADEQQPIEDEKRSLSSLARSGMMINGGGKRNIGSLARMGFLKSNDDTIKRSIATLAKNGQLPTSREPETDEDSSSSSQWDKRNIGSLARSGFTFGKRNIASLARSYQLPSYKRNIGSVLRGTGMRTGGNKRNMIPIYNDYYKRNVGALARDWSLPKVPTKLTLKREIGNSATPKRNIGSFKNSQGRMKRSIANNYYDLDEQSEILEPVYQTSQLSDDELNKVYSELYPYYGVGSADIQEDKRFLDDDWSINDGDLGAEQQIFPRAEKRNIGSLARQGLLRSDLSSYVQQKQYSQRQDKRHIGALARSGWLSAFRPVRGGRFSRSGRARSQIVGYYPQQERLRQPTAAACERCRNAVTTLYYPANPIISWGGSGQQYQQPGFQSSSLWSSSRSTPKSSIHQRSLRGPFHPTGDYY